MAGERTPPETHLSPWEKRRPPREGPRGPSDRHRQPPRQPRSPRPGGTRNPPAGRGGVGVGGRRDFSPPPNPRPPGDAKRAATRDGRVERPRARDPRCTVPARPRAGAGEGALAPTRWWGCEEATDLPPRKEGWMDGWDGRKEREPRNDARASGRTDEAPQPTRPPDGKRAGVEAGRGRETAAATARRGSRLGDTRERARETNPCVEG